MYKLHFIMSKFVFVKLLSFALLFAFTPCCLSAASPEDAAADKEAINQTEEIPVIDATDFYADAQEEYAKGNFSAALDLFQKASDNGDVRADFQLGVMYLYGRGVKENSSTAADYFKKASDNGNEGAALVLGRMYIEGSGVPKNVSETVKIYENAAENNMAFFGYILGKMYLDGEYVPTDNEKALQWLEKAAQQDSPAAFYVLGNFYEKSEPLKASDYFVKSAALGYKPAAFKIGSVGQSIASETSGDDKKIWMFRAAGEGDKTALYELAGVFDHLRSDMDYSWIRKSSNSADSLMFNIFNTTEDNIAASQKAFSMLIIPLIFVFSVFMIIASYSANKKKMQAAALKSSVLKENSDLSAADKAPLNEQEKDDQTELNDKPATETKKKVAKTVKTKKTKTAAAKTKKITAKTKKSGTEAQDVVKVDDVKKVTKRSGRKPKKKGASADGETKTTDGTAGQPKPEKTAKKRTSARKAKE